MRKSRSPADQADDGHGGAGYRPDLARPVRIEREDAEATRNSVSQLPVGASATLGTLLKLALMSSDNRAAHALARSYPGGTPAFERSLRDKMAQLGLMHTTLREPTGLSPANRSTAADIERIVNAAAAYPEIARDSTRPAETVNIEGGASTTAIPTPWSAAGAGTSNCPRPACRPGGPLHGHARPGAGTRPDPGAAQGAPTAGVAALPPPRPRRPRPRRRCGRSSVLHP